MLDMDLGKENNLSLLLQPRFHLLGEAEVQTGASWQQLAPDKHYFLLAYLAIKQNWVSREHLAELFWSDIPSSSARRNLRKLLFKIRSFDWATLDEGVAGLRWQISTDVALFEEAYKQANWQKALRSYRGVLLQGLEIKGSAPFSEWLELERMRLAQLYLDAKIQFAQVLEAKGDVEAALSLMRSSLIDEPLNEASHRSIMRLEHKRGNTEAAFEQFEMLRLRLKSELGVEPLPETITFLKKLEQGGASQGRYALLITDPKAIPDNPEQLLGRDHLLQEAQTYLATKEQILLHGFGGMGKTALAATLASQHLQDKRNKVLWLQVGSENPESVFDALAQPFDISRELAQAEDKALYLKKVFTQHKLTLIVLDDVWNAYSLSCVSEAVPENVALIVTSRQRYPRLKRLSLGRLERPASLQLLGVYANLALEENTYADNLCELLGDHAFAIRIAGLTLRENKLSPKELIEQIKNAPHDLQVPVDFVEDGRASVASLLNASLEPLEDLEYEAFLTYGALYTPRATAELLACCLRRDTEALEDALFTLVQRGLAERISQSGSDLVSYRVHDLAHSYAKVNKIQRPRTIMRAGLEYLRKHKDEVEALEIEISNLLGAAQLAKDHNRDEELIDYMYLLTVEGSYFTARGHNAKSLNLLQMATECSQKNNLCMKTHYLLGKLGDTYQNMLGNLDEAFHYYNHALQLAKKIGLKAREAVCLGLIGQLRSRQNHNDAEAYLEKAYKVAKASGDDLSLCIVLDQMGYVLASKGKWKEANIFFQESLATIERLEATKVVDLGEITRRRFYALLNLGETEHKLGHFDRGLAIREKALQIAKENNNELWMGYAHFEIGEMFHLNGKRVEAAINMASALSLFQNNQAHKDVKSVVSFLKNEGYDLPF